MKSTIASVTFFILALSLPFKAMAQDTVSTTEKKISVNRYQFIDAKNKYGIIKPAYSLSPNEAEVREDKVLINLNSTNLTDIQLQNGQIIDLNQSPLSIKKVLHNVTSAIQPGGGGGI